MTELDVWPVADALIRRHGNDAELEAARLVKLQLERGDKRRAQIWGQVRELIKGRLSAAALPLAQIPDRRSAHPVTPELAEVIAVAESIKRDLVRAIAIEQIVHPAASDNTLISCFNIGYAANAFEVVRHSLLFDQIITMMRIWDTFKRVRVHSIKELVRLCGNSDLIEELVQRERQATHDTVETETTLGTKTRELPFSIVRATPELREQQFREWLRSWFADVDRVRGHVETDRIKDYRHKVLAHSALLHNNHEVKRADYGDQKRLLELTKPIVSKGYRFATGIDHDFSAAASLWELAQHDLWEIVRSASRGKQYCPPPRNIVEEAVRDLAGGGVITISG